jgi:hypothetical protein
MPWPARTHPLPDGRDVHAVYEGEPVGWVVWLGGREGQSVAARDIHDALVDLLDPGDGQWPDWFIEAVNDLAARETESGRRYACACCDQLTLGEPPTGTYEICEECGWEDDPVQFHDPDYRGGANSESLREARENYAKHASRTAPPWPTPQARSELPRTEDQR